MKIEGKAAEKAPAPKPAVKKEVKKTELISIEEENNENLYKATNSGNIKEEEKFNDNNADSKGHFGIIKEQQLEKIYGDKDLEMNNNIREDNDQYYNKEKDHLNVKDEFENSNNEEEKDKDIEMGCKS